MKHRMMRAAGVVAIGLLAAACSSSSGTTASSPPASRPATPSSSPSPSSSIIPAVSLRAVPGIDGHTLVDGTGRPLYIFEADKNGKSKCYKACALVWQPETIFSKPLAGGGAKQALLGTIDRGDGGTQVTYNGKPLYYYTGGSGDATDGPANGQGLKAFGAPWYVLDADGNQVDTD